MNDNPRGQSPNPIPTPEENPKTTPNATPAEGSNFSEKLGDSAADTRAKFAPPEHGLTGVDITLAEPKKSPTGSGRRSSGNFDASNHDVTVRESKDGVAVERTPTNPKPIVGTAIPGNGAVVPGSTSAARTQALKSEQDKKKRAREAESAKSNKDKAADKPATQPKKAIPGGTTGEPRKATGPDRNPPAKPTSPPKSTQNPGPIPPKPNVKPGAGAAGIAASIGPKRSALDYAKGKAGGAVKSYAPNKQYKSDGRNATVKNAGATVAADVAKGAVLGAAKGVGGGYAGIAAGAASGAAAGASKGSAKAAMGAASDTAQNMSNKSKSSSTGAMGKTGGILAILVFAFAMVMGGSVGTQQNAQQKPKVAAASNQCPNIEASAPITGIPGEAVIELSSNTKTIIPALTTFPTLEKDQMDNVKTIIGFAKTVNFGRDGAIIGIMTAMTESTLRNVAFGDVVGPDSRGLFQQRYLGGWGSEKDINDTTYATQAFFFGVGGASNPGLASLEWKKMDPWVAAQKVQRSAFSDGSNYKEHYETAKTIVNKYYDQSPAVQPLKNRGQLNYPDEIVEVGAPTPDCGEVPADGVVTPGGGEGKNDYPAATAPYCRQIEGCPWPFTVAGYNVQCANSVAGGCRGECVDWAGWRATQKMGVAGKYKLVWGDAQSWDDSARANGHVVDKIPEVGALVNWESFTGGAGSSGHIATISKVNADGSFDIEEYNYGLGQNATLDPKATGTPGRYNVRLGIKVSEVSNIIHINSLKGFSPK